MSPVAAAGPPHTRATSVNGGPVSTMNGSKSTGMDHGKTTARVLPHLDDLTTVKPNVDINSPIRRILQDAESLAKQADSHLDFRRPDVALQEFIKASIIAMEMIPRHKDYPSLSVDQGELNRSYMGLLKRIKAQQGRFEEAKRVINEDNNRTGVRPRNVVSGAENIQAPTSRTSVTSNGDHSNRTSIPSLSNGSAFERKKPPIQPKPDALHGKALQPPSTPNSTSELVDLASRFARLRSPAPSTAVQDPRIRTQPITIPQHPGYTTESPTTSQPAKYPTTVRPSGPREMPSAPTAAPQSTRMPLDTQVPGMPKPPDAIYSPSRNPDTAATINFPTSIPRSSSYIGNGNHAAPPVSSAARTPNFDGGRQYFTPAHKMTGSGMPRLDHILPNSTTVNASDLIKYLRMGSQTLRILLVDVRSREEFDNGHIMSPSIICVEPVTLRDGISSEELVESLVLSPDSEQRLYEQRHEFDLVVFYDQRSISLTGSSGKSNETPYLQNFAKAMYDYGYEKQLKRRPMLLLGGVDGWSELMGPSSLQSSFTGSSSPKKTNGSGIKPARPLGRVPMARDTYRFTPGRKRTFESRPLSKLEESKWDETLREHPTDGSSSDNSSAVEQAEISYVRTTEDFFRRYPELPSIQESMISAQPAPKRVAYNNTPINSIPEPPARPAPALPRQRSSGVLEKSPIASYAMSSGIDTTLAKLSPSAGLTGLSNPGVTCYMNAIVQCFSASGPVRDCLINFKPDDSTMKVPRKASETTDPPQLLVRNFGNLLGHMWSGKYDYVAPRTFLAYINAIHMAVMPRRSPKNQAFGGSGRQHDASDFLFYFIGVLHDELNFKRNQPDYQAQLRTDLLRRHPELKNSTEYEISNFPDDEPTSHLNTQIAIHQEWDRVLKGEDSEISRVFHGQEALMTHCSMKDCGFTLKRFRPFAALQLNFPHKYTMRELSAPLSLVDMFWEYNISVMNAGFIEGYKCQKCQRKDICYPERAITYFPDYFIVEIERFSGFDTGGLESAKLTAQVKFTETIDLSSVFIPLGDPPPGGIELYSGQKGPFQYDCYAVVMHHGDTLQSGHYTAMARNLDKTGHSSSSWHRFNDTYVEPTSFQQCQLPGTHVTHIFMKRRLPA